MKTMKFIATLPENNIDIGADMTPEGRRANNKTELEKAGIMISANEKRITGKIKNLAI
jgi:hypothetical protein